MGLTPHEDFDWAPAPGTDGIFVFLSDSFVMPANAKRPDATTAWLTIAASKAGQEAFNPVKGSICARTDCDQSLFNEYLQSAGKDWSTDTVVGSLTHGVVANDAWKAKIDTALGLFLADPTKVADFQAALVAANHNPALKTFADRLRKAGKPHKVIITAVARKLVTLANALCKSRNLWAYQAV